MITSPSPLSPCCNKAVCNLWQQLPTSDDHRVLQLQLAVPGAEQAARSYSLVWALPLLGMLGLSLPGVSGQLLLRLCSGNQMNTAVLVGTRRASKGRQWRLRVRRMFSGGGAAALRFPFSFLPGAASSAAMELVRDTGRELAAAAALLAARDSAAAALAPPDALPEPLPPFLAPLALALRSVASMGAACCASTAAQ